MQLTFGGSALPVTMDLYKENGAWHGNVNSSIGSVTVNGVNVVGNRIKVSMTAENGAAYTLDIELKADKTLAGNWSGAGDGSNVTGRKIK